ncbi:hypothetical protein HRG_012136 [Hirsutella rhossiliensis]
MDHNVDISIGITVGNKKGLVLVHLRRDDLIGSRSGLSHGGQGGCSANLCSGRKRELVRYREVDGIEFAARHLLDVLAGYGLLSTHRNTATAPNDQHKSHARNEPYPTRPSAVRECVLDPKAKRKEKRKTVAQTLDHLDSDSLDFIKLVAFLGGNVTMDLLVRLRKPKLTWGNDGEIRHKIYDDIPAVAQESRCHQAVKDVKERGLLSESSSNGFVLKRQYKTRPSGVREQSEQFCMLSQSTDTLNWPSKYPQVFISRYATIASAILPQLEHVLQYLEDVRPGLKHYKQITEAANVCLSASYFLDIGWKKSVILHAELLGPLDQTWAKIQLRRMTLARIAENTAPTEQLHEIGLFLSRFTPSDKRSNAQFGEMKLFQARLLVDVERHVEALAALQGYQSLEPNISRLEQIRAHDSDIHFRPLATQLPHPVTADRAQSNLVTNRQAPSPHLTKYAQWSWSLVRPPKFMTHYCFLVLIHVILEAKPVHLPATAEFPPCRCIKMTAYPEWSTLDKLHY